MAASPARPRPLPAPCQGAARLLIAAAVVVLLAAAAVGGDLWRGAHQPDGDPAWLQAFRRSAPALWTAGSPRRHPETLHPAVDLRFRYGLERLP